MNLSPSSVIITFTRTTATINMTVNSTDRPPYAELLVPEQVLAVLPFCRCSFLQERYLLRFSAAVSFNSAASFIYSCVFSFIPLSISHYAQRRFQYPYRKEQEKIKITLTKNIQADWAEYSFVISGISNIPRCLKAHPVKIRLECAFQRIHKAVS